MEDTNNSIVQYDNYDYNCMGYALGTFDWEELENFYVIGEDKDYSALNKMADDCVNELITNIGYLRLIEDPDDVREDEYAIAFKVGFDDFHFMRRNSDGTWTQKRGKEPIEEVKELDVFAIVWGKQRHYPYISSTHFFAVRKGENCGV